MEGAVSRPCIALRIVGGAGLTAFFLEQELEAFAIHLGAHGLELEFFEKGGGLREIGEVMLGEAELGGVHYTPLLDEFGPTGGEKDENVVGADSRDAEHLAVFTEGVGVQEAFTGGEPFLIAALPPFRETLRLLPLCQERSATVKGALPRGALRRCGTSAKEVVEDFDCFRL